MFHADSSISSDVPLLDRSYTLSRDISAMQILPFDEAGARLSPVSRLPRGARLVACGAGYDSNTLKVSYEGQFFLVFLEDLEAQKKSMAAAF
jgi:hypothetical protein